MKDILERIIADPRYQSNLDWGRARRGHPEGTIRAHIAELEGNLETLTARLSEDHYWKARVLIHVHDTFKPEADAGVPIAHPLSHASLARRFLAEFCQDDDLLNMVQYHDEGYALWLQYHSKGACNPARFQTLLHTIEDWDLFLAFLVIDGCTEGKSREPLFWFLSEVNKKVATVVNEAWILWIAPQV